MENTRDAMNQTLLTSLASALEQEIQNYELVATKLMQKSEILISGKPQQLISVDQELLALSRKARQLEKQRHEILLDLGCERETLSQTLVKLPIDSVALFTRLRDRLLRAVRDVERLNQDSRALLELSIHWIRDTVELIAKALAPEAASYTPQGGKVSPAQPQSPHVTPQSTVIRSA